MVVNVIPLRRLPQSIGILSYKVDEHLLPRLKPGQIVLIPLRKQECLGVVKSISNPQDKNIFDLKPIISIINDAPLLTQKEINFALETAKIYGVSPSVILTSLLPPLQKNKLKKAEITIYSTNETKEAKLKIFYYKNEEERENFLKDSATESTLIILPTIKAAKETANLLKAFDPILWHSELSNKDKFSNWMTIRSAKNHLVIGTRAAIFLPFSGRHSIVIDEEQHKEHKNWDQAPRFHVKDIAHLISKFSSQNIVHMSYSPSLASYFAAHKNIAEHNLPDKIPALNNLPILVNKKTKLDNKIFTYEALEAIAESKNNIFIYINRIESKYFNCESCSQLIFCNHCKIPWQKNKINDYLICTDCGRSTKKPSTCADCGGSIVSGTCITIKEIEKYLKTTKADPLNRPVLRLDSQTEKIDFEIIEPSIIVGTSYAFSQLNFRSIDTIIFVDLDLDLYRSEYFASEETYHLIQFIQYKRNNDSRFILQTQNPKHIIKRGLAEPDYFYRMELNLRRALLYPPYSFIVRLLYGGETPHEAENAAKILHSILAKLLTKEPKKLKVMNPLAMSPGYYRNRFWYTIIIKSEPSLWETNIAWIAANLPPKWKIDPDPQKLLQL